MKETPKNIFFQSHNHQLQNLYWPHSTFSVYVLNENKKKITKLNWATKIPKLIPIYRVSQEEGTKLRRVFLMLKYTDITQNTYTQSWMFTEIMAREKCGLLAGLRTVPCQLKAFRMSVLDCRVRLQKYRWRSYFSTPLWLTMHVMYSAWNP